MKTSKVQKLVRRLEQEHQILADASTFRRIYAGHWQRSSGAWSWFMYRTRNENEGYSEIGSQYSVTQLLAAKAWDVGASMAGGTEIDPK